MKVSFSLLFLFVFAVVYSQNYFSVNPDFSAGTVGWRGKGDVRIVYLPEGAQTPDALEFFADSVNGRWNSAVLSSSVMPVLDTMQGKYMVLSLYARSDTLGRKFRIKFYAVDSANVTLSFVSSGYSLDTVFRVFYFPFRLPDGTVKFKVDLQCGLSTGNYVFDDFVLEYQPVDFSSIKLFQTWQPKTFDVPDTVIFVNAEKLADSAVVITVREDSVIAPVLPTQNGVNSNFRSKNSLVDRAHLYRQFGAFRYPAGSGSNIYFWDGNVPDSFAIPVNAYSGLSGQFMDPVHFLAFKDSAGGEPTVVVNYFYARYGVTPQGTRQARVLQAARYAADWVRFFNVENGADVKFWEIGNECYGPWETGYNVNGSIVTGTEYGEDFGVFYREMKSIDSTVKIGAVLSHNNLDWNIQVLRQAGDLADFVILHHYFADISDYRAVRKDLDALTGDMLEVQTLVEKCTDKAFGSMPVVLTEFNSQGGYTTNIDNALFLVDLLGTLIKDRFSLATVWVNEWRISDNFTHGILALDDPDQKDYTPRPSYTPFYYYGRCFGDRMVDASVPVSDGLSVYASVFSSGELGVVVINYSDSARLAGFDYDSPVGRDTVFWFSVYAENDSIGNKKFFVNGFTSSTVGGGPGDLDSVPAFAAVLGPESAIMVPPFSVNYFVIKKSDTGTNAGAQTDIKIFPNPAGNTVFVEVTDLEHKTAKWFDLKGRDVSSRVKCSSLSGNRGVYDISGLAGGFYILKVGDSSVKFYKQGQGTK